MISVRTSIAGGDFATAEFLRDDGTPIATLDVAYSGRREEDGAESYTVFVTSRQFDALRPGPMKHSWLPRRVGTIE